MNGTIDLHWNNKISIADGLWEETQKHITVIHTVGVVPQVSSRGPAKNTKTLQLPDLSNLWQEEESLLSTLSSFL